MDQGTLSKTRPTNYQIDPTYNLLAREKYTDFYGSKINWKKIVSPTKNYEIQQRIAQEFQNRNENLHPSQFHLINLERNGDIKQFIPQDKGLNFSIQTQIDKNILKYYPEQLIFNRNELSPYGKVILRYEQ